MFNFFLPVLTDIDINSYDDDTLGTPSVTSFRLNQDVLCIQPASLRTSGSFRSNKDTTGAIQKTNTQRDQSTQPIKFRGKKKHKKASIISSCSIVDTF